MDPSPPKDHQPQSTTPRRAHIAFPDLVRPPNKKRSTTTTSGYTSLRDVLPSGGGGGRHHLNGDVPPPIRNRLVKHAACAYLHPKGSFQGGSSTSFWSFFFDDDDDDGDDDGDGDGDGNDDDDEGGHVGLCSLCTRLVASASTLFRNLLAVTCRKLTGYNDRRR